MTINLILGKHIFSIYFRLILQMERRDLIVEAIEVESQDEILDKKYISDER